MWPDVAFSTGLALLHPHRCAAVVDFDNDGRLDFCRRNFQGANGAGSGITLLQGVGGSGNWIKFRTVGTVSNRDGIGARIDVHIGSHVQRQWVRSGTGYLSSSDLRLQFGAGAATTIDKVVIEWPSGQLQQLDDLAVNQIVDVIEPSMQLTAPAVVGGTTALQMTVPSDAGLEYAMVLALGQSPPSQIPDGRFLPLALDFLSAYTFVPGNMFLGSPLGVLDAQGRATTTLSIPNHPGYLGFTLFATGASFGPPGIPLVRTIFPKAVRITIQ